MSALERLAKLGLELPELAMPVANYVPYKLRGHHLYLSGMIPVVNGTPLHKGHLGQDISIEQGQECARICVLNALAWAHDALRGDLGQIFEVLQVRGLVACTPDFTDHPKVLNGASDLLVEVFGDLGKHTRVAAGASSLPLGVPVEVDFLFGIS
jgi:enamine deaminase RidA (YjgF/YER057c/UK114 family)